MTALSIQLPDKLAQASRQVAKKMGVSRSEFIRRAVAHEVLLFRVKTEQTSMQKAFKAMSQDPVYVQDSTDIMDLFTEPLPQDIEAWWKRP